MTDDIRESFPFRPNVPHRPASLPPAPPDTSDLESPAHPVPLEASPAPLTDADIEMASDFMEPWPAPVPPISRPEPDEPFWEEEVLPFDDPEPGEDPVVDASDAVTNDAGSPGEGPPPTHAGFPGPAMRGLRPGREDADASALAMLEYGSIVAAWEAADVVCKRAPVDLLLLRPSSPGKGLVVFAGAVAEVEEAMAAGRAVAPEVLVDAMLLPAASPALLERLRQGTHPPDADQPVALVEAFACAGALAAADAALKTAEVRLHLLRLADGLGGKAWFVLSGGLEDLDEAVAAARRHLDPRGLTCRTLVLPRPHPDLWVHWQEA
ncbi:MAG: BMC domain-containing protein [Candidatus Sericytochromatia bacterium]|nr:BMC domain-containing protein [Candidatus Sericytochromatia bacterium]